MKYIVILLISLASLTGCSNESTEEPFQKSTEENELLLSAATSLSEALPEVIEAFEEENPYTEITVNYGASGKLAQQIQQGAPVDLFLSADQKQMDMLEEQELILPDTRIDFATNTLVLIKSKNSNLSIQSLAEIPALKINQIAIGNPGSVPAGSYTKEALVHSNVWDQLGDQFVYAKDVRQVLTYVESGNTEIGFVYVTDVRESEEVEILAEIDNSLHEPIVYPATVTSNSTNSTDAESFIEFIHSDTAASIFESYGFNKKKR